MSSNTVARTKAEELTEVDPEKLRSSQARQNELKNYVYGLLPAHLPYTVEVVLSPHVPTACVAPADPDAIGEEGEIDISEEKAEAMVGQSDADYIMFVTTRPAPEGTPISDQATADRAHQYGLVFHETLHILKTAFGTLTEVIENEVEAENRDFVQEIINVVEDGAIERDVYIGDDFTEDAANRLRLMRYAYKRDVNDYSELPDYESEFTFGDAIQQALHDTIIAPPSGVTAALVDEDDDRVTFATESEEKLFNKVYDTLLDFADEIEQLDGNTTERYRHDIEASAKRMDKAVEFWEEVIKPILSQLRDNQNRQQSQQGQQGQQGKQSQGGQQAPPQQQTGEQGGDGSSDNTDQPTRNQDQSEPSQGGSKNEGTSNQTNSEQAESDSTQTTDGEIGDQSGNEGDNEESGNGVLAEIDPDDVTLESQATDSDLQSVSDHPDMGDSPNVDELDEIQSGPQQDSSSSGTNNDGDQTQPDDGNNNEKDSVNNENGNGPDENKTAGDQSSDSAPSDGGEQKEESNNDAGSNNSSGNQAESENKQDGTQQAGSESGSSGSKEESLNQEGDAKGETTVNSDSESVKKAASINDSGADSNDRPESDETQTDSSGTNANSDSGQATFGDFGDNTGSEESDINETKGGDDVGDQEDSESPEEGVDTPDQSGNEESPNEDNTQSKGEGSNEEPNGGGNQSGSEVDGEPESSKHQPTKSGTSQNGEGDQTSNGEDSNSESGDTNPIREILNQDSDSETKPPEDKVPSPDGESVEDSISDDDFTTDRERVEQQQEDLKPDQHDLEEELRDLEEMLQEKFGDSSQQGGEETLESLGIVPPDGIKQTTGNVDEWEEIAEDADLVADTLAKELQISRRTDYRSGVTTGSRIDKTKAYRLGQKDTRIYQRRDPGDEKEYFIALVLDRSNSMGRRSDKIDVATNATAQFALACEDLGINVAVIDFIMGEARLAKPASIRAEDAQGILTDKSHGGGTPLSDALEIAVGLSEKEHRESIIITMTDGLPYSNEQTREVINSTYTPVCSLTVATDCKQGNPPEQAEELESAYERSETVYKPENLTEELDRLAASLGIF